MTGLTDVTVSGIIIKDNKRYTKGFSMSDTVVKFTPSVKFTEIYNTLRKIDMSDRMQIKQGLNYVPW